MALTITPTGGTVVSFDDPADSFADSETAGKWWITIPRYLTPQFGIDAQKSPNIIGKFIKRSDWNGMDVDNFLFMYLNTAPISVTEAYETDRDAVMNVIGGCTLNLPRWNGTLPACECVAFEPVIYLGGRIIKTTDYGLYRMNVMARFSQMRQS